MSTRTPVLYFLLLAAGLVQAAPKADVFQSEQAHFRVSVITEGLENPWALTFLPDGRMLVTERPGRLRIIDAQGKLLAEPVKGLPEVRAGGQGGLLDVIVDPAFKDNQLVYLSYSAPGDGGASTEVARAKLIDNGLENLAVIFRALPKTRSSHHFGSRLVFDQKGNLFITLGDRGDKEEAQNLDNHKGVVVRIRPDGSIPEDNPFVKNENAKPEIYTYGNRNVQGATLNPWTGEIWAHEHGPQGGDEINILRAGLNYGWPTITYGRNYVTGTKIGEGTAKPGMEQPLYYWDPSIAPSGMLFYNGDKFPEWKGDLFVGALKFQLLARLEIRDNKVVDEERLLEGELGRIRDVRQGPDGFIYLLTDEYNGKLVRLAPASK